MVRMIGEITVNIVLLDAGILLPVAIASSGTVFDVIS